MEMSLPIYEKIVRGDPLTDAELVCAEAHFSALAKQLDVLGPHFHFAFVECGRRAWELQCYLQARKRQPYRDQ